MEDTEHNQRVIRAAVVCLLVLVGWMFVMPQPPAKKPEADVAMTRTSTATETDVIPQAVVPAVQPVVVQAAVEPSRFQFKGRVLVDGENHEIPFEVAFTNVGGAIDSFELPTYSERDADNRPLEEPIRLAIPAMEAASLAGQMGGMAFLPQTTFRWPERPVYEVKSESADRVVYRLRTAEGIEVEREYQLRGDSFAIESAITIRNLSAKPQRHRLALTSALRQTEAMKEGGFLFMPPPDHLNSACYTDGSVEREGYQQLIDEKEPLKFSEKVLWAGIDRQYFLGALIPRDAESSTCLLGGDSDTGLATASVLLEDVNLMPGEQKRHKYTMYLGVKKAALLTRVDAKLESAIDYTILGLDLALLSQALLWILGIFHNLTNSWGFAILGLTVLVKAMLFPLNQRSGKSMRAMSALKPEMDGIRERFPEDRQRQSEEMMKLYRTHKVSPAAGCVPILLQMPIWFALYRALWVSVDLYQQEFLWIPDLTARDPFWILPVALTLVMFVQQKMTPTAMDPMQQKMMMYFMPLMFGVMMASLPAGLCFYIFVNTVLTIVQQHFINKSVGPAGVPPVGQQATA